MRALKSIQKEFFQALRIPLPAGITRLTTPALSGSTLPRHHEGKLILKRMKDGPRVNRVERLEIYHRQYWFRILDSLREDFVMTEFILGKRRYQKITSEYLKNHPSRHWTLRALGREFPDYLRKCKGLSLSQKTASADMAALEWAMMEVFEVAGANVRLEMSTKDAARTLLMLSPCLRFVQSDYDLDRIRKAHHAQRKMTTSLLRSGKPSVYCIFRVGNDVHVQRLDTQEWSCLKKFSKGSTIENALEDTQASAPEVSQWFAKWSTYHWLEMKSTNKKARK